MIKENILVIGNEVDIPIKLKEFIETNFKSTIAYTIDDALKSFTNFDFKGIIIDSNLNDDDVFSLISAIRTKSKWLPIIILFGRENSVERIKFLKAGVDDLLTKPFDRDELKLLLDRSIVRFKLIETM